MGVVGVGMHEADADRLDLVRAEDARRVACHLLVERTQFLTAMDSTTMVAILS